MRKPFVVTFASLMLLGTAPALADKAEQDENGARHAASELAEARESGRLSEKALDRVLDALGIGWKDYMRAVNERRAAGDRRLSSGMNRSFDTNFNRSMQMREARRGSTLGMTGGDSYAFRAMPRWVPPRFDYAFDRLYPDTPRWNF